MHKIFLFTILMLGAIFTASAQNNQLPLQRNTVFVEVAGKGGLYSINYDRILFDKVNWRLAGRIGGMFYRSGLDYPENNYNITGALPLEICYLRGKRNHLLELGFGITPGYTQYKNVETSSIRQIILAPTPSVGYRYQKREGGMFYKVSFIVMGQFSNDKYLHQKTSFNPWLGFSIGYTLKN